MLSNIFLNGNRSNASYWTQQSNDLLTSGWNKQTKTVNSESNLPPKRFTSGKQAPPVEQSAKVSRYCPDQQPPNPIVHKTAGSLRIFALVESIHRIKR